MAGDADAREPQIIKSLAESIQSPSSQFSEQCRISFWKPGNNVRDEWQYSLIPSLPMGNGTIDMPPPSKRRSLATFCSWTGLWRAWKYRQMMHHLPTSTQRDHLTLIISCSHFPLGLYFRASKYIVFGLTDEWVKTKQFNDKCQCFSFPVCMIRRMRTASLSEYLYLWNVICLQFAHFNYFCSFAQLQ